MEPISQSQRMIIVNELKRVFGGVNVFNFSHDDGTYIYGKMNGEFVACPANNQWFVDEEFMLRKISSPTTRRFNTLKKLKVCVLEWKKADSTKKADVWFLCDDLFLDVLGFAKVIPREFPWLAGLDQDQQDTLIKQHFAMKELYLKVVMMLQYRLSIGEIPKAFISLKPPSPPTLFDDFYALLSGLGELSCFSRSEKDN